MTIQNLPHEIILSSLIYAGYDNIIRFCQTNKKYYDILDDNHFWKRLYNIHYSKNDKSTGYYDHQNFKLEYLKDFLPAHKLRTMLNHNDDLKTIYNQYLPLLKNSQNLKTEIENYNVTFTHILFYYNTFYKMDKHNKFPLFCFMHNSIEGTLVIAEGIINDNESIKYTLKNVPLLSDMDYSENELYMYGFYEHHLISYYLMSVDDFIKIIGSIN